MTPRTKRCNPFQGRCTMVRTVPNHVPWTKKWGTHLDAPCQPDQGEYSYSAMSRPSTARVTGELFSNSSTKASSIRKKVSSQKLSTRSQACAREA